MRWWKKKEKTRRKIDRIVEKKRKNIPKKMIIYCLSVGNCKKLAEKLNCEMFYHDVGDKKFF